MHWILLLICCASVYAGMVAKSPALMLAMFFVALASCFAWLWVRYKTLFPDTAAVTAGGAGLSDHEMESLRAHVRARAEANVPPAPDSFERPADPDAIRAAAQKVAERDAEAVRLRQAAEREAIAQRAVLERETLELARTRVAQAEPAQAPPAQTPAAAQPEEGVVRADVPPPDLETPVAPAASKPQGPEREVGEVWNPYAGVVQAPKKDVLVHPTSSDAHRDA